ncbi:MAG: MBL fold metallo-hydrolase [bacterium]|nr:MBL fold metallo-hydrolase [bacterium]
MIIQYHGDACVRLSGKHGGSDFTVLMDPYDAKETGLRVLRPSSVDVVLSTTGVVPSFGEGPFIITGPGEYDVRGVSIIGIPFHGKTIYRIAAEDLTIVHLGFVAASPDSLLIEQLGDVDIVFVPVGGNGVLTASGAAEVIERMEPRVVVPIQYAVPESNLPYDRATAFVKEMGCNERDAEDKLKVVKRDLPTDERWVRLLEVS